MYVRTYVCLCASRLDHSEYQWLQRAQLKGNLARHAPWTDAGTVVAGGAEPVTLELSALIPATTDRCTMPPFLPAVVPFAFNLGAPEFHMPLYS